MCYAAENKKGQQQRDKSSFCNSPEVDVEDADGDADGEGDEDHGEEEVFAQEGHGQRGRGDDFGQQQEKHSEREQNRDAEGDFLARVRGQVEDQDGEEGDAHARDDQVHSVEQSLPPHHQLERDVCTHKNAILTPIIIVYFQNKMSINNEVAFGKIKAEIFFSKLIIFLLNLKNSNLTILKLIKVYSADCFKR